MTKGINGLVARYYGDSGGATSTSYYVQAIFSTGQVSPIAGPATVTTPAALSSANIVNLQWEPVPGAIAYNVFKNTTGTVPTGAGAVGLAMGITANAFVDRGQAALTVTIQSANLTRELTLQTAIDTATLTQAQAVNALLVGTPTAAAAYTTPTGAQLELMFPDSVNGQVVGELQIKNTSAGANAITLTAGASGVTITGTATVAQNFSRSYLITKTSPGNYVYNSGPTAAH